MAVTQINPIRKGILPFLLGLAALLPGNAAGEPPAPDGCELSPPERRLALLLAQPPQRRATIRCSAGLTEFARQRARDMASRGYLSHLTPERKGPNQLLRDRGYPLPPAYQGGMSNNVESIAGGIGEPEEVWRLLTASSSHRKHLLGEASGFVDQDEYGIGYYRDIHAPHVDYWVIVIARRARPGEARLLCTPEPAQCFIVAATASEPKVTRETSGR